MFHTPQRTTPHSDTLHRWLQPSHLNGTDTRIMWRILLFLVIVACGLFFYGTRQVWISLGASSEAQLVDISDIQPGQAVEDRHV
ncbi:MAG: hypothetical protein AAFP90_04690, partial [Planctomycetota bacterium]